MDLSDYLSELRFYPHRSDSAMPASQALASAHDAYLREPIAFSNDKAQHILSEHGITHFLSDPTQQIVSDAAHIFAPARYDIPVVVAFRYHSEHQGKIPAPETDCLLKPIARHWLNEEGQGAHLDIMPEVKVLRPEEAKANLYLDMLMKHCAEQALVFWDAKVAYRTKQEGVLCDERYCNHDWPDRSNVGLIPVIKDGEWLVGTDGKGILAPVILDAGAIMAQDSVNGTVPNIQRTDLTFAGYFKSQRGYDVSEIKEKTQDAPSLAQYVSQCAGREIKIDYNELIRNYQETVESMDKGRVPRKGKMNLAL